jgi:hypothetical protein
MDPYDTYTDMPARQDVLNVFTYTRIFPGTPAYTQF